MGVSLRMWVIASLLATLLSVDVSATLSTRRLVGLQAINLRKLPVDNFQPSGLLVKDSRSPASGHLTEFHPHYFEQPLDHFKDTSKTFGQRYWFSTRNYVPGSGGPVIVLDGGETRGEDRLPFLDTGIVEILTAATGGVGVILEHRYYGDSIPVTNFSTDSMRWLNNEQAAADSANFMANVKFPGIDEDLTAPNTPWIYYGGSYAGARAAHMKILYPDLVYGAIASSGVTHAVIANWRYMEVIRKAAEPKCSSYLENSISTIDSILAIRPLRRPLKGLFGLAGLKHDEDFVSLLQEPLGAWQSKNWNPKIGSTEFDEFCDALVKPPLGIAEAAAKASYGDRARLITLPGGLSLDFAVLNYAKYIKEKYVSRCPTESVVEECFGTFDEAKYQNFSSDLSSGNAWTWQVCTQWGFFATPPPDQKHPRIVSRLFTLEYQSRVCKLAFPPGKYFTVPTLPNITAVNALGGFAIAADRLAIIDGEIDPWRPDTPHSELAEERPDTLIRPFKLIPCGVHHYDEFGLPNIDDEPEEIRKIHYEMIEFVKEWLKDWKTNKGRQND